MKYVGIFEYADIQHRRVCQINLAEMRSNAREYTPAFAGVIAETPGELKSAVREIIPRDNAPFSTSPRLIASPSLSFALPSSSD